MKGISTLTLFAFVTTQSFANGGLSPERQERGTAAVDETYVDEIKHKESALKKEESTRKKMQENPRNPAYVESFGQIYSKEDDQESQEERKAVEKQEAREGEAGGEVTEGTVWDELGKEKGRD